MRRNIIIAYIVAAIFTFAGGGDAIGMVWGRQSAQRLIPSTVVDLMMQNGVTGARLFSSEQDLIEPFVGSGINLTITLYDVNKIHTPETAREWVQLKVPFFIPANIRRMYIAQDAFAIGLSDSNFLDTALSSYNAVEAELIKAGYGDMVKVTMPHPESVLNLENVTRPSDADFRVEIKDKLKKFLLHLQAINAPFVIEHYPFTILTENNIDISFGFLDGKSTYVVRDVNGAVYTDVFTLIFDSFVWALKKIGVPDLEIVVGAVSWPTDGHPWANTSTAERFYKLLLPFVVSNKGTPMRPGRPIETFVHSVSDENLNVAPPGYEYSRHRGVFRTNGQPKYKIDLTGRGRDIYPTMAKGIMRMPKRWCVYTGANNSAVTELFADVCMIADCSSLVAGGSCSGLSFEQNVSYAFNMYYQAKFQDDAIGCHFNGYSAVVTEDPSTGTCLFPVEVVRGQQINFKRKVLQGHGYYQRPGFVVYFSLSIFWVLKLL